LFGGQGVAHATFGEGVKNVGGTYYFTRGFFWFLETPVLACLGWFFVAYSCVYVAEILIPKARYAWKATLGGLLAMNLDLWLDPVQTHEKWISWVWVSPDAINIFNIPLSNFIGWFLLIFLFALVFNRLPSMVAKHGYKKATVKFYGILIGLEFCILIFFVVYGAIAFRLVKEPIFITFWGI
jgi:putative membrane protein